MGSQPDSPSRKTQRADARNKLKELYEKAKKNFPGFQQRKSQRDAMANMLDTLLDYKQPEEAPTGRNIAILEAGTGFGKTVGYGLPALAAAFATGKKVVLSTATVALQEQLFERDLPRLAAVAALTGFEVNYTLLKGRQRYLCLSKLDAALLDESVIEQHSYQGASVTRHEQLAARGSAAPPAGQRMVLLGSLAKAVAKKTWNGDRDKWPEMIDDGMWRAVQADRGSCTGRRCPQYQQCSFYEARAGVKAAQVIVANHSLVLATLANETSLFDPNQTLFVFDEGHHLNAVATDHFAPRYGIMAACRSFVTLEKGVARTVALTCSSALPGQIKGFKAALQDVVERHGILAEELMESPQFQTPQIHRFVNGLLPDFYKESGEYLLPRLNVLFEVGVVAMNELRNAQGNGDANAKTKISKLIAELGPVVLRLQTMTELWKQWSYQGKIPRAKWIDVRASGSDREIDFAASGMTSAADLSSKLWSKVSAAIVTSATITVGGSFDYFMRTTGLSRYPDVVQIQAESPFDYATQGTLHVVAMKSAPDQPAYNDELKVELIARLEVGLNGQLALFTSKRQMLSVHEAMPAALRAKVLMQGDTPKGQMLEEHGRRVKAGRGSIIFGLQSFGEGVDLPGALCEHLYIDKIPFKPPGSPTEEALSEWLKSQNRDPFTEVSVPMAAQTLKQWVGRAIRSTTDTATITIFDKRLTSRKYGAVLLDSLPPLPVFEDLAI